MSLLQNFNSQAHSHPVCSWKNNHDITFLTKKTWRSQFPRLGNASSQTFFFLVSRPFERPFLLAPLHSHSPSNIHENSCGWVCKHAWVSVHVCVSGGSQRTASIVLPRASSPLSSFVVVFFETVSLVDLWLTNKWGWQVCEFRGSACLCLPSTWITTASHVTSSIFFTSGFWGSNSRPCDRT